MNMTRKKIIKLAVVLKYRGTPSKILVMDIFKEIIEENTMSGKLKITDKTVGGDTTDTDSPEKSKSKKYLNHHWIKLIQKM